MSKVPPFVARRIRLLKPDGTRYCDMTLTEKQARLLADYMLHTGLDQETAMKIVLRKGMELLERLGPEEQKVRKHGLRNADVLTHTVARLR